MKIAKEITRLIERRQDEAQIIERGNAISPQLRGNFIADEIVALQHIGERLEALETATGADYLRGAITAHRARLVLLEASDKDMTTEIIGILEANTTLHERLERLEKHAHEPQDIEAGVIRALIKFGIVIRREKSDGFVWRMAGPNQLLAHQEALTAQVSDEAPSPKWEHHHDMTARHGSAFERQESLSDHDSEFPPPPCGGLTGEMIERRYELHRGDRVITIKPEWVGSGCPIAVDGYIPAGLTGIYLGDDKIPNISSVDVDSFGQFFLSKASLRRYVRPSDERSETRDGEEYRDSAAGRVREHLGNVRKVTRFDVPDWLAVLLAQDRNAKADVKSVPISPGHGAEDIPPRPSEKPETKWAFSTFEPMAETMLIRFPPTTTTSRGA